MSTAIDLRRERLLPWIGLLAIGVAWGATTPMSKWLMSANPHPIGIAWWQTVIAAVAFGAIFLARGEKLPLSRRHIVFYAICGVLGTVLPHTMSFEAARHLPASVLTMVLSMVPMATLLLAVPLGVERAEPRRILGIGLGAAAVLLIVGPEDALPEAGTAIWVALPVLVAISYAAENVYIARDRPEGLGPLGIMFGLSLAALAMLTPLVIAFGAWEPAPGPDLRGLLLVAMALLHVIAYLGFVWLIGLAGPVFAAQVGYVVTATGVTLAIVTLGERPSIWVWTALSMIFVGLALVRPKRREARGV